MLQELRQYSYFCTSKASKVSTLVLPAETGLWAVVCVLGGLGGLQAFAQPLSLACSLARSLSAAEAVATTIAQMSMHEHT